MLAGAALLILKGDSFAGWKGAGFAAHGGNDETIKRFKREIRLARRITHRNVLRTFDYGEAEGVYFISMEYVRGYTLAELLDEARGDYEWVILDTAPLVLAPDCMMMSRAVDGFWVFLEAPSTPAAERRLLDRLRRKAPAPVVLDPADATLVVLPGGRAFLVDAGGLIFGGSLQSCIGVQESVFFITSKEIRPGNGFLYPP